MRASFVLWLLLFCCLTSAWAQDNTTVPACGKEIPYKYVGNSFSMKFHRPSCPFARQMWAQRMELFKYRQEAIESGYQPCRYCLPPVWTRVRATIRQPSDNDRPGTTSGL